MWTDILISLAVLLAVCPSSVVTADSWTKIKDDIRMPLELRVVNEGLAHDDKGWFMSNQHFLYRTSLWPLTIEVANHHAIPDELTQMRYDHIGDIDHDRRHVIHAWHRVARGGCVTNSKVLANAL